MFIEQIINSHLNKYPRIKRVIKRIYQRLLSVVPHKSKVFGAVSKISPNDGFEYFFGYYDKTPWDASGRYMLCLRVKNTWVQPDSSETAEIVMFDTAENNTMYLLGTTNTWNVQQGCMLQWMGPDYSSRIIYNDIRDNQYCSIILNIATKEERIIKMPVYSVSADGNLAVSLDFSRLHSLRPGYGYMNLPDVTKGVALPKGYAVWRINILTGEIDGILRYSDFASFMPRPEMKAEGTIHKVNHLMLSPNGKRFIVLYRWFNNDRKYTRLITCNIDGSDMYLLSDDDMVSHCFWKNDNEIIAFERKKVEGNGYYLMKDKTNFYKRLWPEINDDGHPSYSPKNKNIVLTDSYPNGRRFSTIRLMQEDKSTIDTIVKVYNPFKYDNETRCDLHPRWSRNGEMICFDACFEGHRGLYVVNINNEE